MTMTDLKPCHVCGEKPRISGCGMVNGGYWCMVTHADTDHSVWVSAEAETEEKAKALAIEKWNRRHYPPEVQQAIERMKPIKPMYSYEGTGKCPVCRDLVNTTEDRNFCWRCGQALDWSE